MKLVISTLSNLKTLSHILTITITVAATSFYHEIILARDLTTASVTNSDSSDDIHLNAFQLSYINNLRGHFWPYSELATSNLDAGIEINRYAGHASGTEFVGKQVQAVLGERFSESFYIGAKAGFHRLNVAKQEDRNDFISYMLYTQANVAQNVDINLTTASDYVYMLGLQPSGIYNYLHATKWWTNIEWKPIETIRILMDSSAWNLSDQNFRRDDKLSLLYGISPDSPWIWSGISYEVLHYKNIDPNYWSPDLFRSVNLELDCNAPINDDLDGVLAISLSRQKEDNYPIGNGHSVFIGINNKISKSKTIRLGFSRIRSAQGPSAWDENSYNISLNGSF